MSGNDDHTLEPVDVLVLGAGPAGMGAAVEASRCGLGVTIVDESVLPGGQIYRAVAPELPIRDSAKMGEDFPEGERLRAELAASPVTTALGQRIWFAAPGFRVEAVGRDGPRAWEAKAVVAATGTSERVIPMPGWTLPGAMGLAAATILLKAQQMMPGRATVVAGCGPLLAAVASSIVKGGGKVAAYVDLATRADWAKCLPAMLARPQQIARGFKWLKMIRDAGTPMYYGHAVTAIRGTDGVAGAEIRPVDSSWRPRPGGAVTEVAADAVAIGHGLVPGTEVARLLQAELHFVADRGGWIAKRDGDFRTTVSGLYVAGDGCGISGGAVAEIEGRIAGLTAALDLGKIERAEYDRRVAGFKANHAKAERFGATMSRMMTPRPGLMGTVTPETVVCRCEDITRKDIEDAMDDGALEVNQLKSWTRCGMGPCQGRMCGEAAARLVADRVGGRENAGIWTARVPIRPVTVQDLIGEYTYDDIPAPAPAPR